METHSVFKTPNHPSFVNLVLPGSHPESVDNSDLTLGIVKRIVNDHFRVAQVGLALHGDVIEIANLQGAGPTSRYALSGLDPKRTFAQFEKILGIKPLNTLLAIAILFSKQRGEFRKIICDTGKKEAHLNYSTVLQALKFRPAPECKDQLELGLDIDESKLLERVIGKSDEKRESFDKIQATFRPHLHRVFDQYLESDFYRSKHRPHTQLNAEI
ncbi:hypothetical protein HZA44_01365 [Candidatus Peregrinibacteria bacterium]|nr:hypothetical protein [Candidatus Peregrinibacteria bacterium]